VSEPPTKTLQTRHGPMKALAGDQFITPCLEVYGEYSRQEWLLLSQIVTRGMTVVEAGANIGAHTVPLARACAPGLLYAFEPQLPVLGLLCDNLNANAINNVRPIPAACGAEVGEARVPPLDYAATVNFGGVSLKACGEPGQLVRVQPVDGLNLSACGLLKIDVEGFEVEVIRGATETIRRCRPIIYVENDRVEHQQALISDISSLGYRLYWHTPYIADEGNFNGATHRIFPSAIFSINMLCVPAECDTQVTRLEEIDPANWSSPKGRKRA
jgi:FkbM family methyltransferase